MRLFRGAVCANQIKFYVLLKGSCLAIWSAGSLLHQHVVRRCRGALCSSFSSQWTLGEKRRLWREWQKNISCSVHLRPIKLCAEKSFLWSVTSFLQGVFRQRWRSGGTAGGENKAVSGTPWRKDGLSPRKQLIELNSACFFSSVQQFLCHGKQRTDVLICYTVCFEISIEFVLQRSVGKARGF